MEVVVNLFYYLNIYIYIYVEEIMYIYVYIYIYMNIFERRYEPNGRHT